jgi:sugar phosphate isomerase/epimerase
MLRRNFLLSILAAGGLSAKGRIDLSRISLLTDEVGKTPAESIAFAKQYGVSWVELRGVPGKGETYAFMDEAPIRELAAEFKSAGLRVSFLNTPMLKFTLPGTEPPRRTPETPERKQAREEREKRRFDERLTELNKAIRTAHILGVKGIRVFTFTRVANPDEVMPKVAEILIEMERIAAKEGVQLLVENENSCNVATSAELKKICDLVPGKAFGVNWDPVNGMRRDKEWPDGYRLLPKKRIGNVQMKAEGLVVGPELLDWGAIFRQLVKDGYQGKVGLETHIFDGTLIEKAHLSMKKIQELVKS